MPHVHPYMGPAARKALLDPEAIDEIRLKNGQPLGDALAQVVADVFRHITGEQLVVGKQSFAHPLVERSSMPVDFAVLVGVDYTEARALIFEVIEQDILDVLSSWDPSLHTEVHLNIFGAPILQTPHGLLEELPND